MQSALIFLIIFFVSPGLFGGDATAVTEEFNSDDSIRSPGLRGYNEYSLQACKPFEGRPLSPVLAHADSGELYQYFLRGHGAVSTEIAKHTEAESENMIQCLSSSRCGERKKKFIEESQESLTLLRIGGLLQGMDESFLKQSLDGVSFDNYNPNLKLPDQLEIVAPLNEVEHKKFVEVGQSILLEAEHRALSSSANQDPSCIRQEEGLYRLIDQPACKVKYQQSIFKSRTSVLQHRKQMVREDAQKLYLQYPWLTKQTKPTLDLSVVKKQLEEQKSNARHMALLYGNANNSQLLQLVDYPEITNTLILAADNQHVKEAFCSFFESVTKQRKGIQRRFNMYLAGAAIASYALCPFTMGAGCVFGALNSTALAGFHLTTNALDLAHANKLHSAKILSDEEFKRRQNQLIGRIAGMGVTIAVGGAAMNQAVKFIPPPVVEAIKEAPKAVARAVEKTSRKVVERTQRLTKAERRAKKQEEYESRKKKEASDATSQKRRNQKRDKAEESEPVSPVASVEPPPLPLHSMFPALPRQLSDDLLSHWSSARIRAKFRKNYRKAMQKRRFENNKQVETRGPCLIIRGDNNQRLILTLATGEAIFSGNHDSYNRFWPKHCTN